LAVNGLVPDVNRNNDTCSFFVNNEVLRKGKSIKTYDSSSWVVFHFNALIFFCRFTIHRFVEGALLFTFLVERGRGKNSSNMSFFGRVVIS
jgi:hypothetical protein